MHNTFPLRRRALLPSLALLLILVENLPFLPILQAFAGEIFKGAAVSIEVPREFEIVPSAEQFVEVVLGARAGGYPSFNIIVLPPDRTVPADAAAFAKRTLDSYSKVGISGEKAEAGTVKLAGRDTFFMVIDYSRNGTEIRSHVASVFLPDKEIVFTFIDAAENYESSRPLLEKILSSVSLTDPLPAAAAAETSESRDPVPAAVRATGVLFILVAFYFAAHRFLMKGRDKVER